jgi:hypothetical protein
MTVKWSARRGNLCLIEDGLHWLFLGISSLVNIRIAIAGGELCWGLIVSEIICVLNLPITVLRKEKFYVDKYLDDYGRV